MRKVICFLFFSLFSLCSFASDFSEGLFLIRKGQRKEGFKKVEKAFEAETSRSSKTRMARILALGQESGLLNNPAYYAKYALKFSDDLQMKDKLELHRVLALHLLKVGQFKESEKSFHFLIQNTTPGDTLWEYSVYHQGWVLINQKKYKEAFSLWGDYLKLNKGSKTLREDILGDFGKIWFEYFWEKGVEFPLPFLRSIERDIFLAGTSKALRKGVASSSTKKKIRVPKQPWIKERFLELVVLDHPVFFKRPCETFHFVSKHKIEIVSHKLLAERAISCLDKKGDAVIRKFYKDMGSIPFDFAITGNLHFAKNNYEEACFDWSVYLTHLKSLKEANRSVVNNFFKNCSGEDSFIQFLSDLKDRTLFSRLVVGHFRKLYYADNRDLFNNHFEYLLLRKSHYLEPQSLFLLKIYAFLMEKQGFKGPEMASWEANFCNYYTIEDLATIARYYIQVGYLLPFWNSKGCLSGAVSGKKELAEALLLKLFEVDKGDLQVKKESDYWLSSAYLFSLGEIEGLNSNVEKVLKGTKTYGQLKFLVKLSKREESFGKFSLNRLPMRFKELQWFSRKSKNIKWRSKVLAQKAMRDISLFSDLFLKRAKVLGLSQEATSRLEKNINSLQLQL